jgi:regulator of sigma E protease
MIVRIYYMLFESDNGWKLALWFSVILNVNLAILNMLPIPVLDGGHIVLAVIESVRRKPVNMRILEWVQTACATLIIGYMLYISFFDIGDLFGKNTEQKSSRKESPASEKTAPPP